jgi:hypothetical protein
MNRIGKSLLFVGEKNAGKKSVEGFIVEKMYHFFTLPTLSNTATTPPFVFSAFVILVGERIAV